MAHCFLLFKPEIITAINTFFNFWWTLVLFLGTTDAPVLDFGDGKFLRFTCQPLGSQYSGQSYFRQSFSSSSGRTTRFEYRPSLCHCQTPFIYSVIQIVCTMIFSGCFITIANYETLQYIPISSCIYPSCLLFKRCLTLASLFFLKKINQCNSVSQSNNPVQSTVSELFFSLSHSSGFAMILLLRLSRWQAIFY